MNNVKLALGWAALACVGLAGVAGCSAVPQPAASPSPTATTTVQALTSSPASPATASASAGSSSAAPSAPSAAGAVPTLGRLAGLFASGEGFGSVKPSRIFNGGDPTGLVSHIVWSSWGGPQAKAAGTAVWVGPNQSVAQGTEQAATVVAFNLGTCDGKLMYQAVEWYFPQHGQTFNAGQYENVCTGRYVPGP